MTAQFTFQANHVAIAAIVMCWINTVHVMLGSACVDLNVHAMQVLCCDYQSIMFFGSCCGSEHTSAWVRALIKASRDLS